MNRFSKKLLVAVGAMGAIASLASPAGAVPAANGQQESLALVGSDTTFDVMKKLTKQWNVNELGAKNTDPDTASNVPPTLPAGGSYQVPADANCGAVTYTNPGNPPPNGSSSGITALSGAAGTSGCVDIARSSRPRGGSDAASLEFFAFAKDGVSWAPFRNTACPGTDTGPVGCAPKNLTQAQLNDIYDCDPGTGLPAVTNWNQVGGDNGAIVRYTAQSGSGTRSFFDGTVLGTNSNDPDCTTSTIEIQENAGNLVAAGDKARALLPYSFAQFTAQANGVVPDLRAGAKLGKINGVAPTTTTIENGTFVGNRFVYNVVRTGTPSYGQALRMVGVDNAGAGYLCKNDPEVVATIKKFGFAPLPLGATGGGVAIQSTCRKS